MSASYSVKFCLCWWIVCHFSKTTDAAFTWIYSDVSVNFLQSQKATLFWSVNVTDVGSGGGAGSWLKVAISRNKIKSVLGDEDLISELHSGEKTKHLQARAVDLDLVVNGTSNVVNVTFTLRNLRSHTDDMYYIVSVTRNNDYKNEIKFTKLDVFVYPGTPAIKLQPVGRVYCQSNNVTLTCSTAVGNPVDTNFTFYANNQVLKVINGRVNGNDITATVAIEITLGINSFACQARNLAGSYGKSENANVATKEPPAIISCTKKEADEGTNLVWTCSASGSQPLTTSWYKGTDNTVISSGNTLNITSVKRSDAGMYRFTVSNGDQCPTASTTVNLTVQCAGSCGPEPSITSGALRLTLVTFFVLIASSFMAHVVILVIFQV